MHMCMHACVLEDSSGVTHEAAEASMALCMLLEGVKVELP